MIMKSYHLHVFYEPSISLIQKHAETGSLMNYGLGWYLNYYCTADGSPIDGNTIKVKTGEIFSIDMFSTFDARINGYSIVKAPSNVAVSGSMEGVAMAGARKTPILDTEPDFTRLYPYGNNRLIITDKNRSVSKGDYFLTVYVKDIENNVIIPCDPQVRNVGD